MAKRIATKLNQLEQHLPEGVVVDAAWLTKLGYSSALRTQYVQAGWLEQPAYRVFRRPRGDLDWRQVVVSLQTVLAYPLIIGGRTALQMQGLAHYLSASERELHLYGPTRPPKWLDELKVGVVFSYHNSARLFPDLTIARAPVRKGRAVAPAWGELADPKLDSLVSYEMGHWDWSLALSAPERAVLELLDELPNNETFHQVDMLMEGLTTLSPRRLQGLLEACRSVKVKRLFFFFADRHNHAWLKRLDRQNVDLGAGKRMLVKGGRYDPTYQITVPGDF